jgi:hypothetical protein
VGGKFCLVDAGMDFSVYSLKPFEVTIHIAADSNISDCRSGRRTEDFVRYFLPIKGNTLKVTMIAGNQAQSLEGL